MFLSKIFMIYSRFFLRKNNMLTFFLKLELYYLKIVFNDILTVLFKKKFL